MTKLDDRDYVRGALPQEVNNTPSTGKHAGPEKKTTYVWVAFLSVFIIALSFALYKQIDGLTDFKPNADGSFPLFTGVWAAVPLALVLASTVLAAVLIIAADSTKHFAVKVCATLLIVFFGTIFGLGHLNSHAYKAWEQSLKTWVSDTYDVQFDYLTEYHYAGVVGKPATKFSPAIYIDPPKNVKYLTSKEGQYLAELMPDVYGGDSVRVYEISNEPNPPLMEVKK